MKPEPTWPTGGALAPASRFTIGVSSSRPGLAIITRSVTAVAPGLAITSTVSSALSVWRSKASRRSDSMARKSPTRKARCCLRSAMSCFIHDSSGLLSCARSQRMGPRFSGSPAPTMPSSAP